MPAYLDNSLGKPVVVQIVRYLGVITHSISIGPWFTALGFAIVSKVSQGQTPYERSCGRVYSGRLAQFGERVMAYLASGEEG